MLRHFLPAALIAAVLAVSPIVTHAEDAAPPPSAFQLQQSGVQDQLRALPVVGGRLFASPPPSEQASGQGGTVETKKSGAPGVARARTATLDSSYLRRIAGARKLELSSSGQVVGEPERFDLNLFEDRTATIVATDSAVDKLGHRIVQGTVVGGGHAILVIDAGLGRARSRPATAPSP